MAQSICFIVCKEKVPSLLRHVLSVIRGDLQPHAGHPKWISQSVYKANPLCYKGRKYEKLCSYISSTLPLYNVIMETDGNIQ